MGEGALLFVPRSLSHGSKTIIFLPFHGTFFFSRGGCGAGDGSKAGPSFSGGGGGLALTGVAPSSPEATFPISPDMLGAPISEKSACVKVSVLVFL